MFRRPHYIAVALVLLIVLILLNLPSRTSQQLKLAIGEIFLPLFGLASSTKSVVGKTGDAVVPRAELLRQIEDLKKENQRLQIQVSQMHDAWRDEKHFRELFNFQARSPWKIKPAQIIGQDPANWWKSIVIGLGSKDGVQVNYPVISSDGFLVGRVSSVSLTRSTVVLLGDANCWVSAKVVETGDEGQIAPRSPAPIDPRVVHLTYLPLYAELQPGQNIVTSGKGEIFPKGIPIGKVIDSQKPEGLYTEARIRLATDFNRMENVWVKFP